MITLPDQAFFIPNPDFVKFFKQFCGHRVMVDCGCGNGQFSCDMEDAGVKVIPIDLHPRANYFHFIEANATTYEFPSKSVPVIARPSRGDWITGTIHNAIKHCGFIIYIGIEEHFEDDIFSLQLPYEKLYDNAGQDKESVYLIGANPMSNTSNTEKTTYSLVKYRAAGSGDNAVYITTWVEDGGRMWRFYTGGHFPKSTSDTVLETRQVSDLRELDWEKTSLLHPSSNSGWLSREGRFYGCMTKDHDKVADLILHKEVGELEKTGWVRVYSASEWVCYQRLSAEQRNWLSAHGHTVEDYH